MNADSDTPHTAWRDKAVLTVPEGGAVLGLGRDAAYAAARRGDMPTLRFGKRILVPVAKLKQLLGEDAA